MSGAVAPELRPPAVVAPVDDLRGLHAARALRRNGVSVIGVAADPRSYGARTRALDEVVVGGTTADELLDSLRKIGERLETRAVIFPCSDAVVRTLADHREELDRWYHLALPPTDALDVLADKVRFYEFAQSRGLPVPTTRVLRSRRDAESAGAELDFPCALKPLDSRSAQWVSATFRRAFKVEDAAQLIALYDEYSPHSDALIAQRWIEGSEGSHYNYNTYLDKEGRALVTFTSRKLRQWPLLAGDGSLYEECRADDAVEHANRLFEAIKVRGLAEVEYKRDSSSGELVIIEPTIGRVSGRCGLVDGSGVEMLYTMYCDLTGRPLPTERAQRHVGAKWVFIRRDLLAVLQSCSRNKSIPRALFTSLRGPKVYALFSWSDPIPFIVDLRQSALAFLSRARQQKRRRSSSSSAFTDSTSEQLGDRGMG